MPSHKALKLSIIIPVYNEEAHLKECLDSIARQTLAPDEVIVVDNNSTDRSIQIAKKYKFVRVITEPRQGMTPAINRGLNAAKGDILGRIDADASLGKDWVKIAKEEFRRNPGLAGLTGYGINNAKSIYAIPFVSKLTSKLYFWQTRAYLGVDVMWGSNMVLRATWWQKIKSKVCLEASKVHEDQDLSLLIAAQGGSIKVNPHLFINFDGTKLQDFDILKEYYHRRGTTKLHHTQEGTYSSPGFKKIAAHKRFIYGLLTFLPYIFLRFTSLFYNRRAKKFIEANKRQ